MNPLRSLASGLSDPPKFLDQFESQALERLGTGLLPDADSPIQKTVVTIWACQGYFCPEAGKGLDSRSLGSTLKRMLCRSFIAFSVNPAAFSLVVWANPTVAPKAQIIVRKTPLEVIKASHLRRVGYFCQRRKCRKIDRDDASTSEIRLRTHCPAHERMNLGHSITSDKGKRGIVLNRPSSSSSSFVLDFLET